MVSLLTSYALRVMAMCSGEPPSTLFPAFRRASRLSTSFE